ncbi:MAG: DUF134 domain-containing protein [Spirochaetales bacterium]|nr:DUF134 domain-containing protein [Spirochaetales bacterium]
MPRGRPCKRRLIACNPNIKVFKPAGIKGDMLESIGLGIDELEAMRHVDFEGKYQQEAAEMMGISRTTLARLLENGRKKLIDAIINSKMLIIESDEDSNSPEGIDNI